MIILIPPSEGKTPGGDQPKLSKVHPLTRRLLNNLIAFPDQEKLLGVKGKKLEESIQTNKKVLSSKTLSAIQRYSGVVYNAIDYDSLKQKKFFDKNVRIVSALFGLVQPQDLIPDYKLKIDKLKADKLWHEENKINDFVIDLLPKAHRKAVSYENGIKVEFTIIKGEKKIAAGHNGKHIKGRFIRWLCENNITNPKDFKKFKEDGFVWKNGEFVKNI